MDDQNRKYNDYQERIRIRLRLKQARTRRIFLLKSSIVTIVLAAAICISSIFIVSASDQASDKRDGGIHAPQKYYTSICVQKNDTLWNIAERYRPRNCDNVSYINELKTINHMTSDTLYAGQNIIIYYVEFTKTAADFS